MMVGIALAALMIGLFAWVRADIAGLRADMNRRLDDLDSRLRAVEHGQAKLEGLLEGLREAIAGRKDAETVSYLV